MTSKDGQGAANPGSDPVHDPKGGEDKLRGRALKGSDQREAADHVERHKLRDPDAELHIDGEEDSLYADGIDIDDDAGPPVGTDGNR